MRDRSLISWLGTTGRFQTPRKTSLSKYSPTVSSDLVGCITMAGVEAVYELPLMVRTFAGWNVNLTPRVPALTASAVPPLFRSLLSRIPSLEVDATPPRSQDFDWALHPGGAKVITGVQKLLSLTPHHLRASYDVYKNHGNSSGASIFSVLNRLREMGEGRSHAVACAFGPGVVIEMCVFRRHASSGSCGRHTAKSNMSQ